MRKITFTKIKIENVKRDLFAFIFFNGVLTPTKRNLNRTVNAAVFAFGKVTVNTI